MLLCRLTGRLGTHVSLKHIYSIAIKSMFISTFTVTVDAVSVNFIHSENHSSIEFSHQLMSLGGFRLLLSVQSWQGEHERKLKLSH